MIREPGQHRAEQPRGDATVANAADAAERLRKGASVTEPRLYHLGQDIGQTKDRAAENAAKVRELQAAWDQWNAELVPPLWGVGKAK